MRIAHQSDSNDLYNTMPMDWCDTTTMDWCDTSTIDWYNTSAMDWYNTTPERDTGDALSPPRPEGL